MYLHTIKTIKEAESLLFYSNKRQKQSECILLFLSGNHKIQQSIRECGAIRGLAYHKIH